MKIVATTQLVVQTMVVFCIYIMDIKKESLLLFHLCIGAWGAWGANLQEITQIEITST